MCNWLNRWKDPSGTASKEEGSFTATIHELEATNRDLRGELDQTSTRLESALDEVGTLRARNCQLESEVETSLSTVKRQEEELARLRGGIGQVMQVLGNLYPQNDLEPRETSAAAEP